MDSDSGFEDSVVVFLSVSQPFAPDFPFPERRVRLTRQKDSIAIGRASKTSSKGFSPAVGNAWFDSAVISRLHARIAVNMDQKKLVVTDLGSLHGTFLNGEDRLSKGDVRTLKDGDTLQFGVPIWRGTEQFAPTTVKVGFLFSTRDGPGGNTFQVPEGSDDEGSDVDGSSSDSDSAKNTNGPACAMPSASAGRLAPNVVDLTNTHHGRTVIDLSSPPTSPIRIDDDEDGSSSVMADPPGSLEGVAKTHVGSAPTHSSPNAPVAQEDPDGTTSNCHNDGHTIAGAGVTVVPLIANEDDASPCDEDDVETGSSQSETSSHIDYVSEEPRSLWGDENDERDPHYDEDLESREYDDEDMESQVEHDEDLESQEEFDEDMGSEEEYTSDEDDDISIDSSPDEPIDDFWDQLPQSAQSDDYPEIAHFLTIQKPGEPVVVSTASARVVRLLNDPVAQFPGLPPRTREPARQIEWSAVAEPQPRQSSPSKGLYTPAAYSSSSETTAEVLGSKTGKTDYFEAREQNKATITAQRASAKRWAVSVQNLCSEEGLRNYAFAPVPESARESAGAHQDEGPAEGRVSGPVEAYATGHSQVISPPPEFSFELANPPLPVPVLRPVAESATSSDGGVDGCTRRTHLCISDIVHNAPRTSDATALKRKAEDISDATEQEELWAAEAEQTNHTTSQGDGTQGVDAPEQGSPLRALSPAPSTVSEDLHVEVGARETESAHIAAFPIPERPAKRARMLRVAECVGYAALGGVTAGAMIMGSLIYTAPTFV